MVLGSGFDGKRYIYLVVFLVYLCVKCECNLVNKRLIRDVFVFLIERI